MNFSKNLTAKNRCLNLLSLLLPYAIIVFAALFLIMPQLSLHSVIIGRDSMFHFNRFYETAKQIQSGKLSYFQSNYCFQQSGRIINAVYGPFFAYLNGLILCLCHSWYRYELVTNFLIYVIGGIGMYRLALKGKSKQLIAILVSLIYMNIGWLPQWQYASNLTAWGAALAPYMAICAVNMVQDHKRPIHWVALMTVMALTIQTHALSSIIFVFTLIPFFIAGLITAADRRAMGRETIKAIAGTLLLTANVWGALLALNRHNLLSMPVSFPMLAKAVRPKLFLTTKKYLACLILLLFIFQLIYVLKNFKHSLTNSMLTLVGFVFLFLSSVYFPWHAVQKLLPILGSYLQFPSRFLISAYPLLLGGIAITFSNLAKENRHHHLERQLLASFLGIIMLFAFLLTNTVMSNRALTCSQRIIQINKDDTLTLKGGLKEIKNSAHSPHPGQLIALVEKKNGDYLPVSRKIKSGSLLYENLYKKQIIKEAPHYRHFVLPHGRLELKWRGRQAKMRRLPVIAYYESRLSLNGRPLDHYQRSEIGAPYVRQRKGSNELMMHFQQPSWFTALLIISLLSLLALLLYYLYYFWTHFNQYWQVLGKPSLN